MKNNTKNAKLYSSPSNETPTNKYLFELVSQNTIRSLITTNEIELSTEEEAVSQFLCFLLELKKKITKKKNTSSSTTLFTSLIQENIDNNTKKRARLSQLLKRVSAEEKHTAKNHYETRALCVLIYIMARTHNCFAELNLGETYKESDDKANCCIDCILEKLEKGMLRNIVEKPTITNSNSALNMTAKEKAMLIVGNKIKDIRNFHFTLFKIYPAIKLEFTSDNKDLSQKEILAQFEESNNDNIEEKIIDTIFHAATKYPLVACYLTKKNYSFETGLPLLLRNAVSPILYTIYCSVYEGKFELLSYKLDQGQLIFNLMLEAVKEITDISRGTLFSPKDIIDVLEFAAFQASENDKNNNSHLFDLSVLNDSAKFPNEIGSEIISILDSLCPRKNDPLRSRRIIQKLPNGYKFVFKQYRLIFLAQFLAKAFTDSSSAFSKLNEYCKIENKHIDDDTYEISCSNRYDSIVILGTAFVLSLSDENRKDFLSFLCLKANNFAHNDRKEQIISIYILSNILNECRHLLSYDIKKTVFKACYGLTMYDFQMEAFDLLDSSSSFFLNEVNNQYKYACELDDSGFAKEQPYYFFLYHKLYKNLEISAKSSQFHAIDIASDDDCIKIAFAVRHLTWMVANATTESYTPETINNLLKQVKKCFAHIKTTVINNNSDELGIPIINSTTLKFSYAVHALLYSIGNIGILFSRGYEGDSWTKANIKALYTQDEFKILFFFDYVSRKSNKNYNTFCSCSDSNSALYLLCGGHRFISYANLYVSEDFSEYDMPEKMQEDYDHFLGAEKDRYKVLQARLLSYSNFFANGKHKSLLMDINDRIKEDLIQANQFLNYDHISIETITDNLLCPRKWYWWS